MTSVTVDASQLSGESAYSGIGTYVRGLLGSLATQSGLTVRALATRDAEIPHGVQRLAAIRLFRQGRPSLYENETMRAIELRIRRSDVFHNPNPHAPRLPPSPWVQTLHDVIPLVLDDPTLAALRRRFEHFGPRYASADAVIAVSRFAAEEGIEHFGISPERVTVIHHGVEPEFCPLPPGLPGGPETYEPPYITVVSEYSRRKRFSAAFEVIAAVAQSGLPHELKVVGRVRPGEEANFRQDLAQAPRPDRIKVLGFVPDLLPVYRGAVAHLTTSRHEGFGLPAVEAMACGVPVVAFSNTAVEEIVGDGGILVPDGDVKTAAAAIIGLVGSPETRMRYSEAARLRSRQFSWAESARRHAEVYLSVKRG